MAQSKAYSHATDGLVRQNWSSYTSDEHQLWDELFVRQEKLLSERAVPEFMDGLEILKLSKPGIPDFEELSDRLEARTGWQVVAVPGLIPDELFFHHLAHKRFVAGRFIRTRSEIDYLQEPDVFHDVFGHVPLLANKKFANYMQAFGEAGLRAAGGGALERLARLYWYTVEFGLIQSENRLKLYGAGIVSSASESIFALESMSPHRIRFDVRRLMRTPYRIDDFQQTYFVIESFDELLAATMGQEFGPVYRELSGIADLPLDEIHPTDKVVSRGSQSYAKSKQGAVP
jgi:phenylalanine-4-hydroxylase